MKSMRAFASSIAGIALAAVMLPAGGCGVRQTPAELFDAAFRAAGAREKITLYSRFLATDPAPNERVVALNNRAGAYREAGDLERALADYDAALALFDRSSEIFTNRGDLYLQRGEFNRAIADFDRAVAADPHAAMPYNHRGFAKRKRGELEAALADYDVAVELAPDRPEGYLGRGMARWEQNRLDAALQDFSRALALAPESVAALANRGAVWRQLGDLERALADFEQALRLAPEDPNVHRNRAIAYAVAGDDVAAVIDYDIAVRHGKTAPDRDYTVLLALLPAHRAGRLEPFQHHLDRIVVRHADWPYPIVRFYRGEIDARALLEATATEDARVALGRRCEAYYFLGARVLMDGRLRDAADYFDKVLATGLTSYIEYALAVAELKRLRPTALAPGRSGA